MWRARDAARFRIFCLSILIDLRHERTGEAQTPLGSISSVNGSCDRADSWASRLVEPTSSRAATVRRLFLAFFSNPFFRDSPAYGWPICATLRDAFSGYSVSAPLIYF